MSLTLAIVSKKGKISVSTFVKKYLASFPNFFTKKDRDNFLFVDNIGSLGVIFEGKTKNINQPTIFSETVKIANKNVGIIKCQIIDSTKGIKNIKEIINKNLEINSSFILLEHTAKWGNYEEKNWLKWAVPSKTPRGNVYLPQGSIGLYFGRGKDEKGSYKNEARGIKFARKFGKEDYPTMRDSYYGKFLDENNLNGLASKKETGLRHFTIGIYEKKYTPTVFYVRSMTIVSNPAIAKTKNSELICSYKPLLKPFGKKRTMKIRDIQPGEVMEYPI